MALVQKIKAQSFDVLIKYSVLHYQFIHWAAWMLRLERFCNCFRAATSNWLLNLIVFPVRRLVNHLIDYEAYGMGSRKESLLSGKDQLVG